MVDMKSLKEKHENLKVRIKALKEETKIVSQEIFNEGFREFFANVPEIKYIRWVQYTPYFNDGDACTFRVSPPSFYRNDEDLENSEGPYEEENPFHKPSDYIYKAAADKSTSYWKDYQVEIDKYNAAVEAAGPRYGEIADAIEDMQQLFASIDDDYFLMMFDDHMIITATAEGFTTDEYSHD